MLVAGMIPMALGSGPGASRRASVAKVIVGGQALSLLLTLLITPVSYALFDDIRRWFGRRFGRGEAGEGPPTGAEPIVAEPPVPTAGGPGAPAPGVVARDAPPTAVQRPATG
jgi:HAE1 family hydrophobic/amphiphilic exporter-1